jgi:hypothetical protein
VAPGAGYQHGIWTNVGWGLAKLTGTANTDHADTAGNLCVLRSGGYVAVKNNLGYAADITFSAN